MALFYFCWLFQSLVKGKEDWERDCLWPLAHSVYDQEQWTRVVGNAWFCFFFHSILDPRPRSSIPVPVFHETGVKFCLERSQLPVQCLIMILGKSPLLRKTRNDVAFKIMSNTTGNPSSLVTVNVTLRNGVIIGVCMGNTSILWNSSIWGRNIIKSTYLFLLCV